MLSKKIFVFLLASFIVDSRTLYDTYSLDPLEHLGGITPYFQPLNPPTDPSAPQGCKIERAAYLIRNAAIYAEDYDFDSYIKPFIDKYHNSTENWAIAPAGLQPLKTWTPPVSEPNLDQLTRVGKLEAMQQGVQLADRYFKLKLPQRIWASSAERTIVSAESLIHGLETNANQIALVSIPESAEAGADSLTPSISCPAYSSSAGIEQSLEYVKQYTAPIIQRLNAAAPSFNFTANDVFGMQQLCGYESVIRGVSNFCSLSLFTADEWLAFEYASDVMYHYNVGYGSPNSGVLGFPWVNSTISQLFAKKAEQELYISLSHLELPATVVVALGLYNNSAFSGSNNINATMPANRINHRRAWKSSNIIPFLGNIAIERMNCSQSWGFNSSGSDPEYYRILVNESPQMLPGCSDGPNESCSRAGLETFLREREDMFGGFSEKCGVTYENTTDVLEIYTSKDNGTMVGQRTR